MFDIDDAMGDVVARSTQPALGAIKLAWWRERLEELDEERVPAEPRLQAVARELLWRGLRGREIAELEEGWSALLQQSADVRGAAERGTRLFELGARLLGGGNPPPAAGRLFAAVDFARRGLAPLSGGLEVPRFVISRELRPISALAALAARDVQRGSPFEAEATPARAWTLLRHRLTGRL